MKSTGTYWTSARNEKPTSVTYLPLFSPMFSLRLNHDLYSARSYTEFLPPKSQPAKISHKADAGLCTFLAIASQQSGNLLDYDWYKRVIRLPLVHTAPSLELLAQTPSNFNLWY